MDGLIFSLYRFINKNFIGFCTDGSLRIYVYKCFRQEFVLGVFCFLGLLLLGITVFLAVMVLSAE